MKDWIMVDIEADGPCPGHDLYSMISIGAVSVEDPTKTFYGKIRPISDKWMPEALKVSGFTRDQTCTFRSPVSVMSEFSEWLSGITDKPRFISDNNGFDWQFVNYYFWHFLHRNPFGHSSTNLGSLYKGMQKNMRHNFKHLRKTKHSHNPVDDALGNVEALHAMIKMGLRM